MFSTCVPFRWSHYTAIPRKVQLFLFLPFARSRAEANQGRRSFGSQWEEPAKGPRFAHLSISSWERSGRQTQYVLLTDIPELLDPIFRSQFERRAEFEMEPTEVDDHPCVR